MGGGVKYQQWLRKFGALPQEVLEQTELTQIISTPEEYLVLLTGGNN